MKSILMGALAAVLAGLVPAAAAAGEIGDESYEAKPWPPEDADGRAADARNECWNHS